METSEEHTARSGWNGLIMNYVLNIAGTEWDLLNKI